MLWDPKYERRPELKEFTITRQIGSGSFGRVYLGTLDDENGNEAGQDGEAKQTFAIKNIRKDRLVKNEAMIKSVLVEFQVLYKNSY